MDQHTPQDSLCCPGLATLVDFHQGRLEERELVAVAEHLSSCPECEEAVRDLHLDGAHLGGEQLRRWMQWPELLQENGWARMKEAIEGIVTPYEVATAPHATITSEEAGRWLGRTVGHYLILEKLGQGGMGVVYRARQEPINREVALKMVLAGIHSSPAVLARFVTEGRAAARMDHHNIVKVLDFGEHEGLPYCVMDLVKGQPLDKRLRKGVLDARDSAKLVRTVALAVQYAHEHDVLHRDLKPGNILLDDHPDATFRPRVTDFGLAKLLDDDTSDPTRTSALLGTPSYMAPEQVDRRLGEPSSACDVYALGAILYTCLTGKPPFQGKTPYETLDKVRENEPVRPSQLRQGVHPHLEAICLKCLEKPPAARYATAQALADDLGRWLEDRKPLETPGWWGRARKTVRRHAVALGLGLAGMVACAAVAAIVLQPPPRPVDEVALSEMQRKLERGEEVTLIGEKGGPKWVRWKLTDAPAPPEQRDESGHRLASHAQSLVELLPDPMCNHYKFSAEVKHLRSEWPGAVGIYVSRTAHWSKDEEVQEFIRLCFNDIRRRTEGVEHMAPRAVLELHKKNRASLELHYASREKAGGYINQSIGAPNVRHEFEVAGANMAPFRHLEIEVSPTRLLGKWDGKPMSISQERLHEQAKDGAAGMAEIQKDPPFWRSMQPVISVRGGLGLYINRGQVSIRNVTVKPMVGLTR